MEVGFVAGELAVQRELAHQQHFEVVALQRRLPCASGVLRPQAGVLIAEIVQAHTSKALPLAADPLMTEL
jgi:hypothetical protein